MVIYDISHKLHRGMWTWPGDPEYRHRWASRIRDGAASNVSAIDLCVHTGTHIDAPFHLDESGDDIARIPLHYFVGPARVFLIHAERCIRADDISAQDWKGVTRALFKTRNSRRQENSADQDFVYLGEDAAELLAQKRILLVGTDAPSVDAFDSDLLPSHRILLKQGIAILEGAKLELVPPGDYQLTCLPLKLEGLDGSPVRAILER